MTRLLDKINSPRDLKAIRPTELDQLAAEIRQEMVEVVSANGGHLASNLGVVELAIALHRVFDSPHDKIIWDVGHQSYIHKLLTGRRSLFRSLRQQSGLSGYTSRSESEHDPFGAGHASTSVSAALGMAIARDIAGDDYHVVAVIGDGAITGGMALEALNHAGHLGCRLIVILNDNGMSISPTVGALAKWLNRVRFDRRYPRAKQKGQQVLASLPMGDWMLRTGRWVKEKVKGLLLPTMIWEDLGFTYMGPLDGHNIHDLEKALTEAANYSLKPALVHVVTTKGKGYQPAEGNAVYFHGVPPKPKNQSIRVIPTYSEVFAQAVLRMMRENPRIVAITPAMPEGNHLSGVAAEFPKRFFDVGICEQHAVTFAAGLATQGFIPIVAIYSTFLQRAFDQIIHDVCLQDLPVVFAIDRSGIVGDDGKTHQGIFDISYLSLIPNLVVAAPKDEDELQHLLYTATKSPHPMAVRYPRSAGLGVDLARELNEIPIGKAEVLREGENVALLALGTMVTPALKAAQELSGIGIEATVVNARFAKPLDSELILDLACRIGCMVTIEENVTGGGFGSAVADILKATGVTIPMKSLGIPDEFIEQGDQVLLRARYGLDAKGIVEQVCTILSGKDATSSELAKVPDN